MSSSSSEKENAGGTVDLARIIITGLAGLLATAFVIGLAGGVHCVAMCGGIVAALHLRAPRPSIRRQLAYSLGRVASYCCAGALAGGLGGLGLLYGDFLPVRILLLVVANALVILLGLSLAGLGSAVVVLERAGSVVWRALTRLGARLAPANTSARAVAVGLAWGWIPCGFVYGVLATALVSGGALRGALVMAAFGLGTLPNLLAAGFAAGSLHRLLREPRTRLVAGLAVVFLGLLGLARIPGLGDHLKHGLH
jgi:sulfite exporter TauE/SafE